MNLPVQKNKRMLSLDVFRGLTIIMMILVNSQGTRSPYYLLTHAAWDGCSVADIVFPTFLYIVGITCVVSLQNYKIKPDYGIYKNIIKRSVLLFCIGIGLNIFPMHFNLETIRVYGVLQRIAICYLISAILYLNTRVRTQMILFLGIVLGYWILMTQIPVPGYGANQLTLEGNWGSYIEQLLFSPAHLYDKVYDPEGSLSTIPALATTILGLLTGHLLLLHMSDNKKLYWMIFSGSALLLSGWIWSYSFPINKSLWTSSYILWTGGCALIMYALCFWIIDIRRYTEWTLPFKIFGTNALFAFIFHVLLLKLQGVLYFSLKNGEMDRARYVITDYLFGNFASENAALLYSLGFLLINFLVIAMLYKRKIFIRI